MTRKKIVTTRKRKTNTRSKKKTTKKSNSFLFSVKSIATWTMIVFVSFIALLYFYDHLPSFREKVITRKTEAITLPTTEKKEASSSGKQEKVPSTTSRIQSFRFPEDAELPKLQTKRTEQIIRHEGYTVSYNSDFKIANWVAYELTKEEAISKKEERTNKFVPDPMVKGATALNEDYSRTGYDRGHLAPAGDMKWSAKAMRESFYFSNICPQKPGLNRGIWKDLEEKCRIWAVNNEALLIITGPVISDDLHRLGKNRVGVPNYFYKVVGTVVDGKPVSIGFLFENKDYKKTSLKSMAITVDSVQKVTGIDFFPSLPVDIQKEMETKIEWEHWQF